MSNYWAPTISVVMAVHNANLSMTKASVSCILNQTFKDIEFIIIDDINSKSIRDYLRYIKNQDTRLKIIHNSSNIGLTRSLVKGIGVAKGKYIARQDIDDISLPERLEFQVKRMELDNSLVLLGTWYRFSLVKKIKTIIKMPDKDKVLKKKMLYTNPFCHSSTMFRKDAYQQVGGYNPRYLTTQDLDLWFRLSVTGKFGMVEHVLVDYGIHAKNLSRSSKAWVQVWNSFIIRLKHCRKVGNRWDRWLVLPAAVYHIINTALKPSQPGFFSNLFIKQRSI